MEVAREMGKLGKRRGRGERRHARKKIVVKVSW